MIQTYSDQKPLYNLFMKHETPVTAQFTLHPRLQKYSPTPARSPPPNLINPVHSCKVNDESLRMEILIFICIHSRKVLLWVFIFLPGSCIMVSLEPGLRPIEQRGRIWKRRRIREESCQTGLAKTWLSYGTEFFGLIATIISIHFANKFHPNGLYRSLEIETCLWRCWYFSTTPSFIQKCRRRKLLFENRKELDYKGTLFCYI